MRIILVPFSVCSLSEICDLLEAYEGYFDGDRHAAVFPFNEELVEELENRGIRFKVVVL